ALERDQPEGFTEPRLSSLIGAGGDELCRLAGLDDPVHALRRLLAKPAPHPPPVRRVLGRLALAYLMRIRRGSRVGDPVAHFHLSNGARLESVNVDADLSPGGRQSHGVMVNYVYDPN